MGVAFHSEIWEKKEKKKHQEKLQELLEIKGIKYISTARQKKRGGGSAITVDTERYSLKEIKIDNPHNLEITYALLRPNNEMNSNIAIILCAVYCPPKSRKKQN